MPAETTSLSLDVIADYKWHCYNNLLEFYVRNKYDIVMSYATFCKAMNGYPVSAKITDRLIDLYGKLDLYKARASRVEKAKEGSLLICKCTAPDPDTGQPDLFRQKCLNCGDLIHKRF